MEPDGSPPCLVPTLDYLYWTHSTSNNGLCAQNESQTFRIERVINSFTRVRCRPTTNWATRHSCTGHHHNVLEISYVCLCSLEYSTVKQNNGNKWIQTGITTPRKINTGLRIKNHNLGSGFLLNKKFNSVLKHNFLLFGIWSNQKDYRTTGVMLFYVMVYWDWNMQLFVA